MPLLFAYAINMFSHDVAHIYLRQQWKQLWNKIDRNYSENNSKVDNHITYCKILITSHTRKIALIMLEILPYSHMSKRCKQNGQQCRPWSDCSWNPDQRRSSLISTQHLYVWKRRIITVPGLFCAWIECIRKLNIISLILNEFSYSKL